MVEGSSTQAAQRAKSGMTQKLGDKIHARERDYDFDFAVPAHLLDLDYLELEIKNLSIKKSSAQLALRVRRNLRTRCARHSGNDENG